MANQVIVTNTGNVQVALTPPPNVQVQISRAAIGTVSNVPTANFANYAANVTVSNQPNITSLGTLSNLSVSGNTTLNNLVVTGNLQVGNLFANNANYANFAGQVVDNTQSNITSVGTLSSLTVSGNVSAPTVYSQGMVTQGYDFVQMQYSNGVALPVSPYDLGTGSWFYLDAGGATWQSNTTGTFKEIVLGNNGNLSASGNITGANANLGNLVTANYFSGDGSLLSNISLNNISNGTSNVSIPVANSNVQVYANNQNWTFTDVGNLLLAGGNGVIQSIANSSLDPINPNVSTMVLTPDQGNSLQALVLDPTTPGHIHLRAPGSNIDQPQANVYLGGEASSFEVGVFNGAVPNLFIHSNNNTWMFDITGNLTLPGNSFAVNYANGTQVPLDGPVANANYANFAGTAYSVDGANVSGTVANANYSAYAGEANTANLATYATTANSVAGANVSGEVANANYSTYSGTAGTANSVALANVVGIGNIANINLTGSSSNVLFGNGVFAPESTSIANANYANFAGNLINGTTNVSIPSANGSVLFSVNNNANLVSVESGGTLVNVYPLLSQNNGLRINSVGRAGNAAGASRIAWGKSRGTIASPLSVQPNDYTAEILTFGHNGAASQTNSVGVIRAVVDNSYTANGANIPIGWQFLVNDTNGGTNNENKTQNFYANGNVSFANAIFGNSLSVSGNVTGSYIIGNGSSLTSLTGANVTGQVAYAAVANSVAVANVSGIGNIATINLDGNASNVLLGNGAFSSVPSSSILSNGTSNISIPVANGNITFSANSNANLVSIETGGILINASPLLSQNNGLRFTSVGRGGNVVGASRIYWAKQRGTIASPLSVQPGDFTAEILTTASNGTAQQTNSVALIRAQVDSSYTANGANIPLGWQILVNDTNGGTNNQTKTQNFWANGNVTFANAIFGNSLSVTGNVNAGNVSTGNVSATGNVNANYVVATQSVYANDAIVANSYLGTLGNVSIWDNLGNNGAFARFYGNISIGNSVTSSKLEIYGNKSTTSGLTIRDGQYRVISDNVNPFTGFSPLSFGAWNNANTTIPSNRFFRGRGTEANAQPVIADDQVMVTSYGVYADSGNTYLDAFNEYVYVTGNDGAGNVTANYQIRAFNTGSNIQLQASNVTSNANISTSANVVADKIFSNSYIQANSYVQAINLNANANLTVGNGAVSSIIYNTGDKTTNSFTSLNDTQFKVTMDGVNPTTGFSPFFFSVFDSAYTQVPPSYMYRARGSVASPSAVANSDEVYNTSYLVYADSGNTYSQVFNQKVVITGNDGVGNVTGNMNFTTFNTGSNINLSASNTYANNFTAANVQINTSGFMKLASYTAAALTAITGQIGWMAAVSDSSGGGNPNGMIAFWDTTHTRWSYIHDNSAV